MRIPFVGQSYQAYSPNVSAERTVNFYPEINNIDKKGVLAMYGTPGYTTYINLATKAGLSTNIPIRGMYEFQGVLLIVSGNKLYRYDDKTTTSRFLPAISSLNLISISISFASEPRERISR